MRQRGTPKFEIRSEPVRYRAGKLNTYWAPDAADGVRRMFYRFGPGDNVLLDGTNRVLNVLERYRDTNEDLSEEIRYECQDVVTGEIEHVHESYLSGPLNEMQVLAHVSKKESDG